MDDIHGILQAVSTHDVEGSVIATIVDVQGSAYKKEGAMMLISPDGLQTGMLSAGCLEEDLAGRIKHFGVGRQAELLTYDMRAEHDLLWGQGSGCNGVIQILVEPVNRALVFHLNKIKDLLDKGRTITVWKELPAENNQMNYLYQSDEEHFGHVNQDDGFLHVTKNASYVSGEKGVKKLGETKKRIYCDCYKPKSRLLIFGAGDDAKPLVSLADQSGFIVDLADWREAFCDKQRFPEVRHFYVGFPNELQQQLKLKSSDFVILLTHNFQRDKELLAFLKNEPLRYLGILGSAKRTKRLLGGQEAPANLFSPIGLTIDAEGPNEIAVSIVAELIQQRKKQWSEEVSIRETS
ncbi:XdhC family protein [Gracilibacillus caseinilyticus]|uniref:XdhC family protein n=1 Tax=Gracilibacillus caseinilyticus TaxID=2932256 RepID=A0ABY4EZT6_9BACI|nr:XdhC/CoxI family protein [Gracilibacillus caseinilyticus]UOQ49913.1 XdhC family protein [Gracilibacillus caseinilyticus]